MGSEALHRGIGSEFGLAPALLLRRSASRVPVREGSVVWLSSGRGALKWAWRSLRHLDPTRSTCLLPAYICPSVVQPFREAGARVEFYRVDSRLRVDLDDLHSRMKTDVLAVVVVHYFGFSQPDEVFDSLQTTDPPVHIIEDATHALLSCSADGEPVGHHGSITIYSPRKFFPVPDGGMAVVDDPELGRNTGILPPDWGLALRRTVGLLMRWLFAKTGAEFANRLAFAALRRAEDRLDSDASTSSASWISRRILRSIDFDGAAERRRRNFLMLGEGLQAAGRRVEPFYEELPTGVTPLGFPVLCERRDELREFLIEHRIYSPIHWRLPPEDGVAAFPHLVDLSEHILTLPMDQRYSREDMRYILDCVVEWRSHS